MRSSFAASVVLLLVYSSLRDAEGASLAWLRTIGRPDVPYRPPVRCESECTDAFSPVCGTNGKTYLNFCVYGIAACKNKTLAIAYTAACVDDPAGDDTEATPSPTKTQPATKTPSVSTPNKTDSQLFGPDEVSATLPSIRRAYENDSCTMFCTRQYDPVCGSDGVTYGNLCTFDEANCRAQGRLTVVSQSECPTKPPPRS